MDSDMLTLVMDSIPFARVIYPAAVLGLFITFVGLSALRKFNARLIAKIQSKKATVDLSAHPKSIEQYKAAPDAASLLKYHRILDEIEQLSINGQLDTTSTELAQLRQTLAKLHWPLFKTQMPIYSSLTTLGAILTLPLGPWVLILLGILYGPAAGVKNLCRIEALTAAYFMHKKAS